MSGSSAGILSENGARNPTTPAWRVLAGLIGLALVIRFATLPFLPTILYLDVIHFDFHSIRHFAQGEFGEGFLHWVPPLFPILIAALHTVVPDLELAARAAGCVVGALTVIPTYGLAQLYAGRRVAQIAALLLAVAPFHVRYSVRISSHIHYVFFFALALWAAAALLRSPSRSRAILFGAAAGLAYWVRQEVVILVVFTALFLAVLPWLARRFPRAFPTVPLGWSAPALGLLGVLVFACYVTPIVVWTHQDTGRWVLSSKSGISLFGAGRHLTDLSDDGTRVRWETMIATMDGPAPPTLWQHLREDPGATIKAWGRNALKHLGESLPRVLGYVTIPFLLVAWFRRRHVPRSVGFDLYGVGLLVTSVTLLSLFYDAPRLMLPLVPLGLVWAAVGLLEATGGWGARSCRIGLGILIVGSLALCVRTPAKFGFTLGPPPEEIAGRWIRDQYGEGLRIMDPSANVAFFAGGTPEFMPKVALARLVTFARDRGVDLIAFSYDQIDRTHLDLIGSFRQNGELPGLEHVHTATATDSDHSIHVFRVR